MSASASAVAGFGPPPRMHDIVAASRRRSVRLIGSPDAARPNVASAERELSTLRASHPLAPVYDVLQRLLVDPAKESGLIVAVTDAGGRLVWVEGDSRALRRAEDMAFVPGADWSEPAVGTSAPGTVLATGTDVQVVGPEHFAPAAHEWNCSAVPVRDTVSGELLGAIDLTGDASAVAPHALPLLRAAAAAAEAELRARRHASTGRSAQTAPHPHPFDAENYADVVRLRLLGRDTGVLEAPGHRPVELSPRHSEILLLLAAHPDGLTGPQLSALLYPGAGSAVTLRAEIARLRAVLANAAPSIRLTSQPYRLTERVRTDAGDVLRSIDRGAHRHALRTYAGAPLPASVAPGVEAIRTNTHETLREAVLSHGGLDAVLHFLELPGNADDVDANLLALRLLPPRSPKRAAIVARLEALEH